MNLHALVKKPFFGRFRKPWQWPLESDPKAWERVQFDSPTGAKLVGLFGKSQNGAARGAVVCAHPMVPEAKGYFLRHGQADRLRRTGYDVLLFDVNGFGESPTGSFLFPADIVAAGQELARRAPGVPVGLYGLSLGAGHGLCALSREGHPFRAAFLEAPYTSLDEFWRAFSFGAYLLLRIVGAFLPRQREEMLPESRIRKLRTVEKLYLVHGDADKLTPPSMGDRLEAASSVPVERWVVAGAKHCQAQKIAGEEYLRRLVSFFDVALAPHRRATG